MTTTDAPSGERDLVLTRLIAASPAAPNVRR